MRVSSTHCVKASVRDAPGRARIRARTRSKTGNSSASMFARTSSSDSPRCSARVMRRSAFARCWSTRRAAACAARVSSSAWSFSPIRFPSSRRTFVLRQRQRSRSPRAARQAPPSALPLPRGDAREPPRERASVRRRTACGRASAARAVARVARRRRRARSRRRVLPVVVARQAQLRAWRAGLPPSLVSRVMRPCVRRYQGPESGSTATTKPAESLPQRRDRRCAPRG